ncbi:hypothetical protein V2A60_009337 [Cordyceps javanica]
MRDWRTAHRSTWKRDGACKANQHNCLDTGHGDQCCDNDSYCFVGSEGESRCCPLGSNCVADSPCNSKSYYCTRTATLSALQTSDAAAAANATETGCCGRRCPVPQYYLCPAELGGNCCPYGTECRADEKCVSVASNTVMTTAATATATTGAATNSATPASPPSQCPSGGGGTCRAAGSSAGGLSTTTKTCIAVTVVASAAVVAGLIAWLWVVKRRYKTRAGTSREGSSSVSEVPGDSVPEVGSFGIAAAQSSVGRAVPAQPNSPADIASPVELDSAAPEDDGTVGKDGLPKPEPTEVYELEAIEVGRNCTAEGWRREETTM